MNELVAILSFIVLASLVVAAWRLGAVYLFVLSATFILLSNLTFHIPVRMFGAEFSWAVIVYSLVYFITNLTCEYYGRATAYRLAAVNVAVQLLLWAYVWASLALVPAPSGYDGADEMQKLLGTSKEISVAALLASSGPFLGIYIYSWLQSNWIDLVKAKTKRATLGAAFLQDPTVAIVIRNKLSTLAGQVVNTMVFFLIVDFRSLMTSVIFLYCTVKAVVAIADIPFLIFALRYGSVTADQNNIVAQGAR